MVGRARPGAPGQHDHDPRVREERQPRSRTSSATRSRPSSVPRRSRAPRTRRRPPPSTEVGADLAGTAAVNVLDHEVEARIGATARLRSGGDLQVLAEIDRGRADRAPRRRGDAQRQRRRRRLEHHAQQGDVEIALAVAVGSTSRGPTRPSSRRRARREEAIRVESTVSTHFCRARGRDQPGGDDEERRSRRLPFMLDGTLGLSSGLFNVWTVASPATPTPRTATPSSSGHRGALVLQPRVGGDRRGRRELNQESPYRMAGQSVDVHAKTPFDHRGDLDRRAQPEPTDAARRRRDALGNGSSASPPPEGLPQRLRQPDRRVREEGHRPGGHLHRGQRHRRAADDARRDPLRCARPYGRDGDGLKVAAEQDICGLAFTYTGARPPTSG